MKKRLVLLVVVILPAAFILASCTKGTAEVTFDNKSSAGYYWTYMCDSSIDIVQEYTGDKNADEGTKGQTKFTIKPTRDGNYNITFVYTKSSLNDWEIMAEYQISVDGKKITEKTASYREAGSEEPLNPIHLEIK